MMKFLLLLKLQPRHFFVPLPENTLDERLFVLSDMLAHKTHLIFISLLFVFSRIFRSGLIDSDKPVNHQWSSKLKSLPMSTFHCLALLGFSIQQRKKRKFIYINRFNANFFASSENQRKITKMKAKALPLLLLFDEMKIRLVVYNKLHPSTSISSWSLPETIFTIRFEFACGSIHRWRHKSIPKTSNRLSYSPCFDRASWLLKLTSLL